MFPDSLLNSPLFGIGLTVILYAFSEILVDRLGLRVLPPFVPACVGIIALLTCTPGVEYKQYATGAEFINFLLGPATIALALPLYKNRKVIAQQALPILGGVTIATLVAIAVVYFCAKGLGASEKVLLSLIPKSVTTPIAMEVCKTSGGIPSLTAAIVVIVGLFGAIFGFKILEVWHVRNPFSQGISMGTAAHAVGTSRAMEKGETYGAYSSLGLILNGVLTALLTPFVLKLLGF